MKFLFMSKKLRLIIVEDDPLIAFDIKGIVEDGGYEVVKVFHSASDAVQIAEESFDLALLDININGERDGINLGVYLKETYGKPCFFISSYYDDETVNKAKKAEPMAYVLKPYEERDILINLELARHRINQHAAPAEKAHLFVKSGGSLTKIVPSEVLVAQAYDMYTHLFVDGKRITASQTLKEIEKLFASHNFVRVHRSFMVNMDAVEGICDDEILIGGQHVPVGRTYKKDFFDRIRMI